MFLRSFILTCGLFCLLLAFVLVVDSCRQGKGKGGTITEQPDGVASPGSTELPPIGLEDEIDSLYEQLLRKRKEYAEKILEAFEAYSITSQKVHIQQEELRQYLGNNPISETIDLFADGKSIPPELRVAYSRWQTLLPDAILLAQIERWIEDQRKSNVLEDLDVQIKVIENQKLLGKFVLEQNEREAIDRLIILAGSDSWQGDPVVPIMEALLEQEAIKRLKNNLAR